MVGVAGCMSSVDVVVPVVTDPDALPRAGVDGSAVNPGRVVADDDSNGGDGHEESGSAGKDSGEMHCG